MWNSRPLSFPLLQVGQNPISLRFPPAVSRQEIVIAVPDDRALSQDHCGLIHQGPIEEIQEGRFLPEKGKILPESGKKIHELGDPHDFQGTSEGPPEFRKVPGKTIPHGEPGQDPFLIADSAKEGNDPVGQPGMGGKSPDDPVFFLYRRTFSIGREEPPS